MVNRVRPRCPKCEAAMAPVFVRRPRGSGFMAVRDTFWCGTHRLLARGRRKVAFF